MGTAGTRTDLGSAVALVRRYIGANDGRSLEPACVDLASLVAQARRHPAAADADVRRLWSGGLDLYAEATTACGQLFDGTQLEVGVLLERTTTALDRADRVWGELDRLVTGPPSPAQ